MSTIFKITRIKYLSFLRKLLAKIDRKNNYLEFKSVIKQKNMLLLSLFDYFLSATPIQYIYIYVCVRKEDGI